MKLKTRLTILVILWVLMAALALRMASNQFPLAATGEAVKDIGSQNQTFRTMTVAVCEKNASGSIRCHDEIKVVCGDEEYLLPKEARQITCGSRKMEIPSITSFEVFDKGWKDPRLS